MTTQTRKAISVDYNAIQDGGCVFASGARCEGLGEGDRVLTYDGDAPDDSRCNSCEGAVIRVAESAFTPGALLVDIQLDWDTWR